MSFIDEMLPAPIHADLETIVEFKDAHGPQLHKFRRRIERAVSEVIAQPDYEAQRQMINTIKVDLHDEKEGISRHIEERFRNVILWPLVTVAAIALSAAGSENADPRMSAAGAAFGLTAAVRQSFVAERAYKAALADPLAYAIFYENWFANPIG